MTFEQSIITIALIALATIITRFLPFVIFRKNTPKYIQYLGTVLPNAVIALLIVYCLKDVNILEYSHGLPEFLSILLIAIVHILKRNALLSIFIGTVSYMIFVQYIFV